MPLFFISGLLLLQRCGMRDSEEVVAVKTIESSGIRAKTATLRGTIIDITSEIDEHGHCWSESGNPTIKNYRNRLGAINQMGPFQSDISGLEANKTYYYKAYVVIDEKVVYGKELSFRTLDGIVKVNTLAITGITLNSATIGGEIIYEGDSPITERGICWSTVPGPVIESNKIEAGSGTGFFSAGISGLSAGATYYVRTYASNALGTTYGNELEFRTDIKVDKVVAEEDIKKIAKEDEKIIVKEDIYEVAKEDNQAVVTEEIAEEEEKAVVKEESREIIKVEVKDVVKKDVEEDSIDDNKVVIKNDTIDIANKDEQVVVKEETKEIAREEEKVVVKEVIIESAKEDDKKVVVKEEVKEDSIELTNVVDKAFFNEDFQEVTNDVVKKDLLDDGKKENTVVGKEDVRTLTTASVTTKTVTDITMNSAISGGIITDEGGSPVTEIGICWAITANPTIDNSKTATGSETGSFIAEMTGLSDGTIYYVRAYATNAKGTSYGDQKSFEVSSIQPEMVSVPGGTFSMGCDSTRDGTCQSDEKPAHNITLSGFYIGKHEITHAQYIEFLNEIGCNSNGSYNDAQYGNVSYINMSSGAISYREGSFYFKGNSYADTASTPVIYVSWFGANAYCLWAGGRLPTEAEWEYAARGGAQCQGYKYSGSNTADEVSWYSINSNSKTHAIGTKKGNEISLHDMSGNVWEWCSDWHSYTYYSSSPSINPQGSSSGSRRVLRGGSWDGKGDFCGVTNRNGDYPAYSHVSFGFRLVKDL